MRLAPEMGGGGGRDHRVPASVDSKKKNPLAREVMDRWAKIDDDLVADRKNYWMNLAFYQGHQWLWWDSTLRAPRIAAQRMYANERMRVTVNQIAPRINRLVGRICDRDLFFDMRASAADDATLYGARLSAELLESRRTADDWESQRETNLLNNLFGGTAFVSVDWNPRRGRLWENPENSALVGEGEAELRCWSIAAAGLEAGSKTRDAARFWIGMQCNPPEQVQEYYDMAERPRPDGNQMFSPLQRSLLSRDGKPVEVTAVYVMYERPNSLCPEGRVVHVVNGEVVDEQGWPFPFKHLNIEPFRWQAMPESYRGNTPVNDARSLQVQYNSVRSNLLEHIKLAGNARLWVPNGVLDDDIDLTDEPGEIVMYNPDPAAPGAPQYSMPAPLPRAFTQELETIAGNLDDILYSHDVSRGIGADRISGLTVASLAEQNDTPLGPPSRREAGGWGRVASQILKLYEANAKERRTMVVTDERGVAHMLDWNGARLRGQTNVVVPQEVTLPTSRPIMRAMWAELLGQFPELRQNLDAPKIARLLDISDQSLMTAILDRQAAFAQWENSRMAVDEVMIPQPYEHHDTHIAEHNDYRATPEYAFLPPETKQLFEAHLKAHEQYAMDQALKQAEMNAVQPGLAGLPQADAPVGSALPVPSRMLPAGAPAA